MRDYTPIELIQQQAHNFEDRWLVPQLKLWRLNHAPTLPAAEKLNISRDRRQRSLGERIIPHPLNGVDILSPRRQLGRIPSDGVTSGLAINKAHPTERRVIRVGRRGYTQRDESGSVMKVLNPHTNQLIDQPEQALRELPVSEDTWVHHSQWPERPAYDDRSTCFIAEDGSIWAIWQWDPRPGVWPVEIDSWLAQWLNHAASWGRFNNRGELLEGTGGSTANGDPWVCTTLTPDLVETGVPVLLSAFIGLYHSHKRDGTRVDGLLERDSDNYGIHCGDVLLLPRESKLYKTLRETGPVSAYIAECFATNGLLINDQAGSKQTVRRGSNNEIVESTLDPKAPALRVQACSDWRNTDIGDFQFSLKEFVLAKEQSVEFRVDGDPHTPLTSEGEEDPRHALVNNAAAPLYEAINQSFTRHEDQSHVTTLLDGTVSEAHRLIDMSGNT